MNLLFIGNCMGICTMRYLPIILNQLPNRNINIEIIHVSSARVTDLNNIFDEDLSGNFDFNKHNKTDVHQIIFKYEYGKDLYNRTNNPHTTIKHEIENNKWDAIVFSAHPGKEENYIYKKEVFETFVERVRGISDSKIYYIWGFVPTPPTICGTWIGIYKKEIVLGAKDAFLKLNHVDSLICNDNNVIPIKIRLGYEKLIRHFPKYRLSIDHIHPDRGIGEYFCSMYMYEFFFGNLFNVHCNSFKFNHRSKKKYFDGSHAVWVDEHNKELADNIIGIEIRKVNNPNNI